VKPFSKIYAIPLSHGGSAPERECHRRVLHASIELALHRQPILLKQHQHPHQARSGPSTLPFVSHHEGNLGTTTSVRMPSDSISVFTPRSEWLNRSREHGVSDRTDTDLQRRPVRYRAGHVLTDRGFHLSRRLALAFEQRRIHEHQGRRAWRGPGPGSAVRRHPNQSECPARREYLITLTVAAACDSNRGSARPACGRLPGAELAHSRTIFGLLLVGKLLAPTRRVTAAFPLAFALKPMEQRAKILVVDDNAQNRALARESLEDEGYEVVLAENGPNALRAIARERPDCVLLDVRMPGMDGFAVCAKIRALPEGADTPVVFLTALRGRRHI
jgi:hypothetical protein